MVVALADIGKAPRVMTWSNERYLALVESGVIPESRGIELIDGQVTVHRPQGELHQFLFFALQEVFEAMEAARHGVRTQPTIQIAEGQTYDPEFAMLRSEARRLRRLPRGEEVLWAVEVSVTSRATDLGPKKAAYAVAGVPEYWVVDALKRGIWTFTEPVDGEYRRGVFIPAGETMTVPVIGATLDTGTVFPPE